MGKIFPHLKSDKSKPTVKREEKEDNLKITYSVQVEFPKGTVGIEKITETLSRFLNMKGNMSMLPEDHSGHTMAEPKNDAPIVSEKSSGGEKRVDFSIGGMHFASCAAIITRKVKKLPAIKDRSEERSVGKEWRSRWAPY